jgi:hypothetical protein
MLLPWLLVRQNIGYPSPIKIKNRSNLDEIIISNEIERGNQKHIVLDVN